MVKSMTGFGRATSEEGAKRNFSIEVKSVNNRYLDINIRMPRTLISLEEKVRKVVTEKLNRGKVDIFINYKNYGESENSIKLDLNLADNYVETLKQLEDRYHLNNDLSLSLVAKFPDVIKLEEKEENLDDIWSEIEPIINKAIEKNIEMRIAEGEKLEADITVKCANMEEAIKVIEERSESIVEVYKNKLQTRIKDLLGNIEVDEGRIATEVAIFADKAAVDEEITRFYSHLSQMLNTLKLDEPVGRKMDFIVQEMNREANTIASKSTDIDITNIVINIKNTIEKIREQIQNIE
ncbi:YicC/YloC family endoribonuclease [Inconstantimicrobium mannanitabidum]|uniref:Uncharacterized protein n=1 Tax=Inconstantimicrobium mannanitabidum TaxID=1604901 RepID=A0ACB5RBJ1_9CLOT|nr:YicC/YloC family endoribonuclease [Clostridium sp. TW13]GKX66249.1 hypothetical protein rsdtw13_15070 [Clostridium sp. TW13]